ncbi:MAG: adenylyl-sulfate kinase [Pseudomonadota bacterium]
MASPDTSAYRASVTRARREALNGHRSVIVWFTGLSGSGKSTLAHAVEEQLHLAGCRTFVLDGDNVRQGLCQDLGFSEAARTENIRRIGEVAKLGIEAGTVVLTAFISPFADDRARVRALVAEGDFIEVFCACPLAVCETRDVKGLYRRARSGEIAEFTGISSPYEAPPAAELVVDTAAQSLEQSVASVLALLRARGIVG